MEEFYEWAFDALQCGILFAHRFYPYCELDGCFGLRLNETPLIEKSREVEKTEDWFVTLKVGCGKRVI